MLRAVLFKILFLIGLALFLPRILLLYAPYAAHINHNLRLQQTDDIEIGLISLPDYLKMHSSHSSISNVLLVTNQLNSFNQEQYLGYLADYRLHPKLIYQITPQVVAKLPSHVHSKRQCLSDFLVPQLELSELEQVEGVVVDLQNSGFVTDQALDTLIQVMQLAVVAHKPVMLLDRPNPLGYLYEGPMAELKIGRSRAKIPWRYGISLGELASFLNSAYLDDQLKLIILPVRNYLRNQQAVKFEQLQLVYTQSFFELLNQICPADIKRDCHDDFQCFSLPEYLNFPINKWYELRSTLRKYEIDVSLCRYLNRRTQQHFVGVRLMINDINRVSYVMLWQAIVQQMQQAQISVHSSEKINRLFGKNTAKRLLQGKFSVEFSQRLNLDLQGYAARIKPFLLYRPWPIPVLH